KLKFEGKDKNKFGLGVRAYVKTGNNEQMHELTLTRGFQSSVAPELHFGLLQNNTIDELRIVWPDGKMEKLENVKANQTLTIKQSDSKEFNTSPDNEKNFLFATIKDTVNFPRHKHEENFYDDFAK